MWQRFSARRYRALGRLIKLVWRHLLFSCSLLNHVRYKFALRPRLCLAKFFGSMSDNRSNPTSLDLIKPYVSGLVSAKLRMNAEDLRHLVPAFVLGLMYSILLENLSL